ncbi:hypothetical protein [Microbacterium sp.]|uniref:hypothetical protein n=1 Tax=Microbacterium sp. TaxID=51671 RepID=UPI00281165C9|nr:hypothetical protein [Microbacterium sp.]
MGGYTNGRFPLSMMVKLGDQHYLPAGTAARWRWVQRAAWEKYRVWLIITPGWNGYRPYDIQVEYRKDLGIWAAVPGYSSHGLIYKGRLCAAIDVANWAVLGWARFKALCRLAGFTVDFVSPQELWHIGDFNDIWTPPSWAAPTGTTTPAEPEEEDEDMLKPTVHARIDGRTEGEWMLGHPDIGTDLPVFTGTVTDKNSRKDGKAVVFRGFMVTTDKATYIAWARIYAKGAGNITSSTDRAGYLAIQRELSRISGELAGATSINLS